MHTCLVSVRPHKGMTFDQGYGTPLDHEQINMIYKDRCPSHNSLLQSWILMIFHTIVVHDTKVRHDLI